MSLSGNVASDRTIASRCAICASSGRSVAPAAIAANRCAEVAAGSWATTASNSVTAREPSPDRYATSPR